MRTGARMTKLPGIFLASLLAVAAPAQTGAPVATSAEHWGQQRSFAVVEDSSIRTFQGDWDVNAPLYRYVKQHPGSYIVFSQAGTLYTLDAPERIAEVHKLYAPIEEIALKQKALAHAQGALAGEQGKLSHSQQALSKKQQSLSMEERAAGTPEDQTRIGRGQTTLGQAQNDLGRTQGDIGGQQGDIGALQGALGRQQGDLSRAANKRLQTMFDGCLADGTCRRVTS